MRVDREPLDEGSFAPVRLIQGALAFENVTFAYEGEEPVLPTSALRSNRGKQSPLWAAPVPANITNEPAAAILQLSGRTHPA